MWAIFITTYHESSPLILAAAVKLPESTAHQITFLPGLTQLRDQEQNQLVVFVLAETLLQGRSRTGPAQRGLAARRGAGCSTTNFCATGTPSHRQAGLERPGSVPRASFWVSGLKERVGRWLHVTKVGSKGHIWVPFYDSRLLLRKRALPRAGRGLTQALLVGIFGSEDVAQLGNPAALVLTRLPRTGCRDLGPALGSVPKSSPRTSQAPP